METKLYLHVQDNYYWYNGKFYEQVFNYENATSEMREIKTLEERQLASIVSSGLI